MTRERYSATATRGYNKKITRGRHSATVTRGYNKKITRGDILQQ
jgi:hypothetical protein